MTTATFTSDLVGLGVPWPLATYFATGRTEFNGINALTAGVNPLPITGLAATTATAAGGAISITGGAGGSTSGNGGSLILAGGSVTSGTAGVVATRATVTMGSQATPTAKTVAATLTAAEILAGIITANQGGGAAANYTLPTATNFEAAFPLTLANNDSFDFFVVNISTVAAEDITIVTNTGWTLVGSMVIAANSGATEISSAQFRARRTAANTFTLYRLS